MHAVRYDLLVDQICLTGHELWIVEIEHRCTNKEYEKAWLEVVSQALEQGITGMAFGDLFLEDIRAYREKQLEGTGMQPLFPLWLKDTTQLAMEMQTGGLKAHVTCIDPRKLDPSFVGREWDAEFLNDIPYGTDPCGENGEFHTFVHAGPMLKHPLATKPGEVVEKDGFVFADYTSDWEKNEARWQNSK